MESVERDIAGAHALAHKQIKGAYDFEKYSAVFLFGTENQEGINDVLNYKDKTVLAPASSGDQYFGSVYYGAKHVDIFDVNRMTKYVTYLKIAAVRELSYKEFIDFFVPLDKYGLIKYSFWSLETLKRLLCVLPGDVAYFWDKVMFELKRCGYEDLIVPDFHPNEYSNLTTGMPFYASEEDYYKLQSILRGREYPIFIESDVLALKDKLSSKYDIVYLSNIIECMVNIKLRHVIYSYYGEEDMTEQMVTRDLLTATLPLLKKNGTMLVSYRPNVHAKYADDWLYINRFFNVTEVPSKFPPSGEGRKVDNTDLVLTYRPKKNGDILKYLR